MIFLADNMMNTLKSLLGENADEKINQAMNMLKSSGLMQNADTAAAQSPVQTAVQTTAPAQAEQTGQSSADVPGGASQILTPEGIQFLGQIRSMVDQISNTNDSRSNLLRSLKPFMRTDRQQTIDRAIRIMNIGRFSGLFGR